MAATVEPAPSSDRETRLPPALGPGAPRRVPVAVLPGDGIGPEITAAVRRVLDAAGARVVWEEAPAGRAVGGPAGLPRETLDAIGHTGVVLKGPLAAPAGGGTKDPNVTLRKLLEAFANVRPARGLPGVRTPFSGRGVDLVVVRENVEDLHAGVEHMQTPTVAQALKLVTLGGCARVVRFACELARDEARHKVTCATKADVLRLTEGMMQRAFAEVAAEYPELEAEHLSADNVARQLVRHPEQFGVIVTTNSHGDILGDLAAGLVGGLGVAPSANVGHDVAIFEAVHGAAPDLAGRDLANPTALLLSAVMLLRHVGDAGAAGRVARALEQTLRAGLYTRDLATPSAKWLGTSAFADAVVARLDAPAREHGDDAEAWPPATARRRAARLQPAPEPPAPRRAPPAERTVGVDVFVQFAGSPQQLGEALASMAAGTPLRLLTISNRGTQVYPDPGGRPSLADHYHCRFVARDDMGEGLVNRDLLDLLDRVGLALRWVHVERLREFDGVPGFTQAQGQT